ncbi:MAG: hypothetical protein ACRDRL_29010 [Sciscionella sp.]
MASATTAEAPPQSGESHRAAQAALVSLIANLIAHAWERLVDPHDLKASTPKLVAAVEAIVTHYGRASTQAALTDYRNQRRAAGVVGRVKLPTAPTPSHDDVQGLVEHSLSPMYGPVDATVTFKVRETLADEVERMVLDQSRGAIIGAVHADPEAKAWARVTEPGACSFCRLLATRGAVYRSDKSADFRAHLACRCHVEPVFVAYEATAQIRQDQAEYKKLTEKYGKSGRAIHVAWRQHVEGRPVTGPLAKPYKRG